jgi:hypothetical protein
MLGNNNKTTKGGKIGDEVLRKEVRALKTKVGRVEIMESL